MKVKKCKKQIFRSILCLLSVLIIIPSVAASAVSEKTDEIGYETYTYWYEFSGKTRKAVYSKPMYEVGAAFSADDLGCTGAVSLTDVHVSEDGLTYILDGGGSRVIILDKEYKEVGRFGFTYDDVGNNYYFNDANGIFVDSKNAIYIADSKNARVIKCDITGRVIKLFTLPESNLIPAGFNYTPMKVAVDNKGYVYILSKGSYYGAILYSPDDEFLGFYGSNDVAATVAQALTTLWNKLFTTNAQRGSMVRSLPYTFSDLWVDKEGFVYTATGGNNQISETAQIKRLNPGGSNILASADVNFADEGYSDTLISGPRYQSINNVAAGDDGFIYCIDSTYGRIYIYDDDCTLVQAFGGGAKNKSDKLTNRQEGMIYTPSGIAYNYQNQDVIVSDSFRQTLTVYKITDYGKLVKSAQAKTIVGDYEESKEEWEEVITLDRNSQIAYAGLSKAYYVMAQDTDDEALKSKYLDKAIEISKAGFDRDTYSLAFGSIRTEWIRDNFTWMMLIVVLIVAGIIYLLVYSSKHKMRLVKNEKAHYALTVMTHPFDTFREVKERNLTSIPICLIIIALYYIFSVMESTMGGFAFVYFDASSYNALLVLAKTAGIVILWTVVNWAVCTLLGGKGKMKEIFTVISYSLIPSLVGSIIFVIASNVLTPSEAAFLNVLNVIFTAYTYILLAIGSITIHDYGFGKFIWTTILTLLGCAIVLFLLITVGILAQQTWGFIATLYYEILKLF